MKLGWGQIEISSVVIEVGSNYYQNVDPKLIKNTFASG